MHMALICKLGRIHVQPFSWVAFSEKAQPLKEIQSPVTKDELKKLLFHRIVDNQKCIERLNKINTFGSQTAT